jgi:hypothetical protein
MNIRAETAKMVKLVNKKEREFCKKLIPAASNLISDDRKRNPTLEDMVAICLALRHVHGIMRGTFDHFSNKMINNAPELAAAMKYLDLAERETFDIALEMGRTAAEKFFK